MRSLKTISYFSHDVDITTKRKALAEKVDTKALSETNLKYMRAFIRHLTSGNWERSVSYLKKLSKSSLFLTAIARGGFIVKDAAKCSRKEIINRVIEQINIRNKKAWLRDVSFDGYVNMIADALHTEFRCDSVAAYYIIKNNKIRINRGWAQGWRPEEAARHMQR